MARHDKAPADRPPPHSLEMERSVLGAMLIDAEAIDRAAEMLRTEDFYLSRHQMIYEALVGLRQAGLPTDLVSVQDRLKEMPVWGDVFEAVGGNPYIFELTQAVPTGVRVEYHARKVEETAILRRLLDVGARIQSMAFAEYEDIGETLACAEQAVSGIIGDRAGAESLFGGEVQASALPAAQEIEPLWYGLYPGMATILSGESGAGKSSLLYNVAIALGRNEPLWSMPHYLHRPLRIYYIDPENAGSYRGSTLDGGLCKRKLDLILEEGDICPPTLIFHDGEGLNLSSPSHMARLERRLKRGIDGLPFDLVILDPILAIFNVEDENSNAEMGRVGKAISQLSRRASVAVIAVHHLGKALSSGVYASRGASALVTAFDVIMTLRARKPDADEVDDSYQGNTREGSAVCQLQIQKDRPAGFGTGSVYLRQAGRHRFVAATWQEWRDANRAEREAAGPKHEQAKPIIRELLADGDWMKRDEILSGCRSYDIGRINVDQALREMVRSEEIESARMSGATLVYRLRPSGAETEQTPARAYENQKIGKSNGSGGQFSNIPIFQPPARACAHAQVVTKGEEDITKPFFDSLEGKAIEEDPPGYDPFKEPGE